MNYPNVTIAILNWDGWKDIIECLESLYQITYPNYDANLVDNESEYKSIEKLRKYHKGYIKVKSKFLHIQVNRYTSPIPTGVYLHDIKPGQNKTIFLNMIFV